MSSIDTRVVEMKFDKAAFERGINETLAALGKLKEGLKLDGATKGLNDINESSKRFSISNITSGLGAVAGGISKLLHPISTLKTGLQLDGAGKGIDEVSGKVGRFSMAPMITAAQSVGSSFSAMQVAGVTAIATLVNKAVNAGTQMTKSLTIAPITGGLSEYELKLSSIQTILANTQASGATLKDVGAALNDLNKYSDQTIYNFGQMAKNIGTFTAAGVDLETATGSIKGIANLAALSGSSSEQASTAMYQLSQAISAGRVSLMDWNSVVNAGMGGSVFQRALAETGVAMGKLPASAVKLEGAMKNVKIEGKSFRDSISAEGGPSWLTSEVLTTALQNFTGDMKEADLVAQGFSASQAKAIMATAKTAKDAATIVKTGSQLMGTLKEAAESGWAQTWELIIGDFEEAKQLWTGVNNVFGGFISASADARNKVLGDWKSLGGRTMLIEAIKNAFAALMAVIKPIKDALRIIFPAKTGKDLYDLTVRIKEFTEGLKIGGETAQNLRRTFAGIFAIFSIIGQVVSAALSSFLSLFDGLGKGTGGFLEFTAGIGMWLQQLDKAMKEGDGLKNFFDDIVGVIKVPLGLIKDLAGAIGGLFSGFNGGGADKALGAIGERLSPLQMIGEKLRSIFSGLGRIVNNAAEAIGGALTNIGDAVGKFFTGANYGKTLDTINTGLLAGILLIFKKFFSGFSVNVGGAGALEKVGNALDGVTGALKTMQANVKANILLKIAGALALLTASIVALSMIDSKDLAKGIAGLAAIMVIMQVAIVSLTNSINLIGAAKLPLIAAGLMGLALAVLALAAAVKVMASMELGDMLRGLTGIAAILFILTKAIGPLSANSGGIVRVSAALILLGVALNLMAVALKVMATMSWEEMAKGLVGFAGALGIIAGAMNLMPKNMLANAAGILALSVALNAMAIAMKIMATMSWEEMGKGLVGIAGALVGIAAAMNLMPKNMLVQSVALVAVSGALVVLAGALKLMATMSWEDMAKGLVTLGGSLLILAGGLTLMSGTLGGAAALLVAAGALAVLVPLLITLGSLSWQTIVTGLAALAGVFVVFGIAGLALGPVLPIILGLGAAFILFGAGLALVGVGLLGIATALGILATMGAAAEAIIIGLLKAMIEALPDILKAFGEGIIQLVKVIGEAGPDFVKAFSAILSSLLEAIIKNVPKIAQAFITLVSTLLKTIDILAPRIAKTFLNLLDTLIRTVSIAVPRLASAALTLITSFLNAIASKLPGVIDAASRVIVAFIDGISRNLGKIIESGVKLIISFVNGVANAIRNNSAEMGRAGGNLATAIVEGMAKGIAGGLSVVTNAAKNLAKSALNAAKNFLGIKSPSKEFEKVGVFVNQGFVKGLTKDKAGATAAYNKMRDLLSVAMKGAKEDIADYENKLAKLLTAKKKDTAAINETRAALAASRVEYAKASAAHKELTTSLVDEQRAMVGLETKYTNLSTKLQEAQKVLDDAKKTRDDYAKSVAGQYSDLPDVTPESGVTQYVEDVRKKVEETKKFATLLQKLRDMGLNDTTYAELLAKGIDAMPFMEKLAALGTGSVDELNKVTAMLQAEAKKLGGNASKALYQAGVDSAQGIVNGIKSQQSEVIRQMEALATAMLKAIRKKLGIKSPSREFAKLGAFSSQGMAQGLREGSSEVGNAADQVANEAMTRMKTTLESLSDAFAGDMDLNPTIAPVLDLSQVRKDAARMGGLLGGSSIKVGASYSGANAALSGYNSNKADMSDKVAAVAEQKNIQFIQNNTSPKALSPAEIYRQTKNQLSIAKGALV